MQKGTLNELVLTRSVTKHIRKHNKKFLQGNGVGDDYAGIDCGEQAIVWTEGSAETPYLAWCKAMNNFATSGGRIIGVRLNLMLPENTEESDIKAYMGEFNTLADSYGIQIMGGDTKVSDRYVGATFIVSVMGMAEEYISRPKEAKPGYDIVMTKYTGILGSDIIAETKEDILCDKLAKSYVQGGYFGRENYSVVKEAEICVALMDNICYMHDVSYGGVYGALWQLGSKLGKGLKINHYDIPIKQETIEFAEIFNVNPYTLEGTGSLLIVAKDGEQVVKTLESKTIPASIIGTVTEGKERYITLGDSGEKRYLEPIKGDDIYKIDRITL